MSLGRGLSSLIPPKITFSNCESKVSNLLTQAGILEIPLSKIVPNPHQPRQTFNHGGLEELVSSIKQYGVLQPLLVSDLGSGSYELIAGERRLRASKMAGLKTIPVILKTCDSQKKLELALIENLHREDLNPIEEARAYKELMQDFGLKQEDVSKKMGKSRSQISNTIRLLSLSENIQRAIADKKIPASSARLMVTMTEREQEMFLEKFLKNGMTVREIVKEKNLRRKNVNIKKDVNLLSVEEELREVFETKVSIRKRGQRGQIIIDFYSEEEFGGLVKKLKKTHRF